MALKEREIALREREANVRVMELANLEKELPKLDANRPTAVLCQSGYRSSAATSILAKYGFKELFNVVGGTSAWINAGFAVEGGEGEANCPSMAN